MPLDIWSWGLKITQKYIALALTIHRMWHKISILLTKKKFCTLCTFNCGLTLKLRTRPNEV